MAKIKKIQENGTTVYPVTISKAVKNIRTGKTLDEIILGDGSATEEEFSFRPTAGVNRNTLNDGAARIHTLKGNSVVWNQKSVLRTADATPRTVNGITLTTEGDDLVFNGTASEAAVFSLIDVRPLVKGHKYYVDWRTNYVDGSWNNYAIYIPNEYWMNAESTHLGLPFIKEASVSTNTATATFTVWAGKTVQNIRISKKTLFIDLTQMFGAGNEPATVEEFYQRLPIGVDLNAYNAGEIVDGNYGAIKTVGFNAFNGTYAKVLGGVQYYLGGNYTSIGFTTEEGGTTEAITVPTSSEVVGGSAPADRLHTPSQNGYIYATGENICISLYWPTEYGNLYGTYQPYKPFVRDLGDIIAKYFTDGVMRSAGSVRDEIRWNSTKQKWEAVTRIGEVDLGKLSWGPTNIDNVFYSFISTMRLPTTYDERKNGLLCSKYAPSNTVALATMSDKSILRINNGTDNFYIKDTAFTSSIDFKEAMQGVMLNYELADEYVTVQDIEENINLDYDVSDYGTEELIVADGVESAPLSAEVIYDYDSISTKLHHLKKELNKDTIKNWGSSTQFVKGDGSLDNREFAEKKDIADLENKANKQGTYQKMTVGFAQDIVGDGSATTEEFSFRPTAGEDRNVANTTYYDGERNGAARIEKIKGNTVVWNQKCKNTKNQSGGIVHTIVDGVDSWSGTSASITTGILLDLTVGHKVLFLQNIIKNPNSISITFKGAGTGKEVFMTVTSQSTEVYWMLPQGVSVDGVVIYLKVIDLTQMFGAGNEPATVEEFYQRMPVGIDLNAYNEGKIIDGNYDSIKTTGFNQWDEQWELGSISNQTGNLVDTPSMIRSKNYFPIIQNTDYHITIPNTWLEIMFYDEDYKFIRSYGSDAGANVKTPFGARYARFRCSAAYGTTYNNDICINLSWNEYTFMNGMYQPYKPFTRDLSWVSKYFPNGMRSAGSARDEIRFNSTTQKWETVQKVGVVDLGSLSWTYGYGMFQGIGVNSASGHNVLCPKYSTGYGDKEIRAHSSLSGYIYVNDSSFTDAATFKAAMQGVMLNYELAEPIVTPITENVNLDFDVSDYGTEKLIVAEGEQSAPIVADIIYEPNALNAIKQVPDILKRLKALESAIAQQTTNVEPSEI